MGYGDTLMAIGEAEALFHADPERRVAIGDGEQVEWTSLSWGLPFLATQDYVDSGSPVQWVISHASNRPYIDYEAMRKALAANRVIPPRKRKHLVRLLGRYIWKDGYRAIPARIVFTPEEQKIIDEWSKQKFVCVEPFIKPRAPVNKQWPFERYRELVARLAKDMPVVQLSAPGHETFPGAVRAPTRTFREAAAYIQASRLYVGAEGGLHHAAAAVRRPAVVLFGGFVDPAVTGYDFHSNLTGGADHFCGTRYDACPHCTKAMANITVDEVLAAVQKRLTTAVNLDSYGDSCQGSGLL